MVELKYFVVGGKAYSFYLAGLHIKLGKDGNPAHEYYIMQMNKYAHIKKLNYIS